MSCIIPNLGLLSRRCSRFLLESHHVRILAHKACMHVLNACSYPIIIFHMHTHMHARTCVHMCICRCPWQVQQLQTVLQMCLRAVWQRSSPPVSTLRIQEVRRCERVALCELLVQMKCSCTSRKGRKMETHRAWPLMLGCDVLEIMMLQWEYRKVNRAVPDFNPEQFAIYRHK